MANAFYVCPTCGFSDEQVLWDAEAGLYVRAYDNGFRPCYISRGDNFLRCIMPSTIDGEGNDVVILHGHD